MQTISVKMFLCAIVFGLAVSASLEAQSSAPAPAAPPKPVGSMPVRPAGTGTPVAPTATIPGDYVIGVDDVLSVIVLREPEMSADAVVRPDGKVSLPVLNEVMAAGLTPEQLRVAVTSLATKFKEEPAVSIVIKQINSRKVFVTGEVAKPGPYALSGRMTVIQLIALAGGLNEYAKAKSIAVIRTEGDVQKFIRVNYEDVLKGKNLKQNVELKVGDVVMVQ